jgi:hypothetical protein
MAKNLLEISKSTCRVPARKIKRDMSPSCASAVSCRSVRAGSRFQPAHSFPRSP